MPRSYLDFRADSCLNLGFALCLEKLYFVGFSKEGAKLDLSKDDMSYAPSQSRRTFKDERLRRDAADVCH